MAHSHRDPSQASASTQASHAPARRSRALPAGAAIVLVAAAFVASITFGATRPNTGNPPPVELPAPTVTPTFSPIFTYDVEPAPRLDELAAEIAALEADNDVIIGVAISPIAPANQPIQEPWHAGTVYSGPAGSTIDLAMAMAIMADTKQPQNPGYVYGKALGEGSRAGDQALWAFLGTPEDASAKIEQVLASYGYSGITVPEDGEAPYLQAQWSLADQAGFMGSVKCTYLHNFDVLNPMNSHRQNPWGLQLLPMSYSTSDLTTDEGVSARQTGTIITREGVEVAVALMVETVTDDKDADHDQQVQRVTDVATEVAYLARQATGIREPSCM